MANKEAPPKAENFAPLYRERLVHLKRAQAFASKGEIPKAVDCYKRYLHCLALIHSTSEDKLNPKLFDKEKDLTELFLISHSYWDLSKAYDRAPALKKEAKRCLEQFVKFTVGFKYQHVNYRMLKKFIKKKTCHNPELFAETMKQLKVETKGCYVASHAFGDEAIETVELRRFKLCLLKSKAGNSFVDIYYSYSPSLVTFLRQHRFIDLIFTRVFFKPLVAIFLRCYSR